MSIYLEGKIPELRKVYSMARGNRETSQGVVGHGAVNCECTGPIQRAGGKRRSAISLAYD